jgi:hypothetical protein
MAGRIVKFLSPAYFLKLLMNPRLTICFFITSALISASAQGQHLFGNPNCTSWQTLAVNEKTSWLNAFLAPLNLTNVARKKLKEDKFSKLTSLDTAVSYVDVFCAANTEDFASVAAIKFLDELTLESHSK